MTSPRLRFVLLNVLGGLAVLASYGIGLASHAGSAAALWGGVPLALRPLYTASMLAAAAGYFCFTSFVLLRVPTAGVRFFGRFGFPLLEWLYAVVLVPSAAWMPLTLAYLDRPSRALWWLIRFDLALVGLGSLGLLAALVVSDLDRSTVHYRLAVLGLVAFCFQTAVLDAVIWPALFR